MNFILGDLDPVCTYREWYYRLGTDHIELLIRHKQDLALAVKHNNNKFICYGLRCDIKKFLLRYHYPSIHTTKVILDITLYNNFKG